MPLRKYLKVLTKSNAFKRRGQEFVPVVKPQDRLREWIIWKGDTIMVNNGSEKGKMGEVTKVERTTNSIYVRGVNVKQQERHYPWEDSPRKIEVEEPINVSDVSLIDPVEKKPSKFKIAYVEMDGGKFRKTRVSELTGTELPFPMPPVRKREETPRDTTPELVNEVTFKPDLSLPPIPSDCQLR